MLERFALRNPGSHPWINEGPAELLRERYAIAPGQEIMILGCKREGRQVVRSAVWGFEPPDMPAGHQRPRFARAEGLPDKKMFRDEFRRARCVIPFDGWYQYQRQQKGPGKPFFFYVNRDGISWMAGLATLSADKNLTAAIISIDANAAVSSVDNRMPLIFPSDDEAQSWIDQKTDPLTVRKLLKPIPADAIDGYPVGSRVLDPQIDGPDLIIPANL